MNKTPSKKSDLSSNKERFKYYFFGSADRAIGTLSLLFGFLSLILSILSASGISSLASNLENNFSFISQYLGIITPIISISVGLSVIYFGVAFLSKRKEQQKKLAVVQLTNKERELFDLVELSISELLSEEVK